MLKRHQFWACVAMAAMLLCMITGMNLVSGKKAED